MRARLTYVSLLLLALAFPALAQDRRGAPSLDRVLPQIARTVPGTFSDAEGPFISEDGRATYHIKWMTPDGRIMWFTVDARTGQMMGGAPQFRNNDYSDRNSGDRRNNWNDDRNRDRDGGRGWNQGDRGDRRDWNRGGDRNDDRGGRDWNGRNGDRGGHDWNGRGGRGNDRGGHDRRHGG